MTLEWVRGRVVSRQEWTEGLFTIGIESPGVEPFEPGQFLQLGLEVEGKMILRPYSVASPHADVLEFYIVLVENGELTPKLYRLAEGDGVFVSKHGAGRFTLEHSPIKKNVWLIATGTGLAPYIAMLRSKEIWLRYENVILVHGVRHKADLSYQSELSSYYAKFPDRFAYVPMTSREENELGLSGRIPIAVDDGRLESFVRRELTAESSTVLLCGNPDMLTEMEERLGKRGMVKHRKHTPGNIVLERYW